MAMLNPDHTGVADVIVQCALLVIECSDDKSDIQRQSAQNDTPIAAKRAEVRYALTVRGYNAKSARHLSWGGAEASDKKRIVENRNEDRGQLDQAKKGGRRRIVGIELTG